MWEIIIFIIAIIIIFIGTSKLKINPFLVLLFSAFFYGLASGMNPSDVIFSVKSGFGDIFQKTGLIYICGVIIGLILDKTGAAKSIAQFILKITGKKGAPIGIALSGCAVSIPVNCDSGFVILSPMSKAVSKTTKISVIVLNVALACGLYTTHTLIPPTAGPTAVAGLLEANFGELILLGLPIAIVSTLLGLFFINRLMKGKENPESIESEAFDNQKLPNAFHSFLPILYPILLICLNTIANLETKPFGNGQVFNVLNILGEPMIALLVGMLISFTLIKKSQLKIALTEWCDEALKIGSTIILINSAAGAFAGILKASTLIEFISTNETLLKYGLFSMFIIAAILKTAQGSTTVAMVTTAGIVAPLMPSLGLNPAICVLAIGAGSMVFSHANDSFFWVVTQFTGMSVKDAMKKFSLTTAVIGMMSFIMILLLNSVLY